MRHYIDITHTLLDDEYEDEECTDSGYLYAEEYGVPYWSR